MAKEHLKEALALKMRRPFVPFRVVTTSGKKYRVNDMMQLAVTETLVCYADPKTQWFIEVKADDIAKVEVVSRKKRPAA